MKTIIVREELTYRFDVDESELGELLDKDGFLDESRVESWFCGKERPWAEADSFSVDDRNFDAEL